MEADSSRHGTGHGVGHFLNVHEGLHYAFYQYDLCANLAKAPMELASG